MISGLKVIRNYITSDDENNILSAINQSSGYRHQGSYRNMIRLWVKAVHLPMMKSLCQRLLDDEGLTLKSHQSVLVNEYLPNQGIAPHIDAPEAGEKVAILGLMSSADLVFKRPNYNDVTITINPCDLVVLEGEVRHLWTHEIVKHQQRRYSIVFRNC